MRKEALHFRQLCFFFLGIVAGTQEARGMASPANTPSLKSEVLAKANLERTAEQTSVAKIGDCAGIDTSLPREAVRYRSKEDGARYAWINQGVPLSVTEWTSIVSQSSVSNPIDPAKPIPGIETQIATIRAILIGIQLNAGGELEIQLSDTLSRQGPAAMVIVPPRIMYCGARGMIAGLVERDGGSPYAKSYVMKTPVLIEVRGYLFLDISQVPKQPTSSQEPSDLPLRIPAEAWHLLPVLEVKKIAELNKQRPDAPELIRKSLARIDQAATALDRNHMPLLPATGEALDYMKKVFVKPGWVPDRYVDALQAAADILEAVGSNTLSSANAKVPSLRFIQGPARSPVAQKRNAQAKKDVEEELQIMRKGSQEPDGVVHNIRVSASTVKSTNDGKTIDMPGWEIFYMEYFLKYSRQEVGPDSFKKPSTPAEAELPPGRYLFRAIHPATRQKSECKVATLLAKNPDQFTLFVQQPGTCNF